LVKKNFTETKVYSATIFSTEFRLIFGEEQVQMIVEELCDRTLSSE